MFSVHFLVCHLSHRIFSDSGKIWSKLQPEVFLTQPHSCQKVKCFISLFIYIFCLCFVSRDVKHGLFCLPNPVLVLGSCSMSQKWGKAGHSPCRLGELVQWRCVMWPIQSYPPVIFIFLHRWSNIQKHTDSKTHTVFHVQ